ncbi:MULTISPECIES: DUF928 domain-containing protein [Spirulina sp. CCY15215]|uniref:DUF928 domain-containing protein n=1 Tax=Spirulina sp. CCY15215 TaxID=2767591 RepID=UPI001950290C|nr:DUF928 domain-containing protein [Spirulina major]
MMIFPWTISNFSTFIPLDSLPSLENHFRQLIVTVDENGNPPTVGKGERNPCDESNLNLTPIVINQNNSEVGSNWGKTSAERPILWVYIPYTREQLSRAKLSVRTQNEEEIIYEERLSLNTLGKTPGLVPLSLEESENTLEMGQWYRWYLFLDVYCTEEADRLQQDSISAWVQRSENVSGDRLYDHLAEIAAIEDPQTRKNAWIEILRELGYDAIADGISTPEN